MGRGGVKGLLMVWLVVVWGWAWASAADNPAEECKDDFQKVMSCLEFATGKATVPTKDCCTAVEGIKEDDPKCLCFIIQQTHSGGQTIRSLGIQEAKLLQLPSACHLKNATVSNCPKLLGLPPGSPDAAVFDATGNNTSSNNSSNTPATPKPSDISGAGAGVGTTTNNLKLFVAFFAIVFFYALT